MNSNKLVTVNVLIRLLSYKTYTAADKIFTWEQGCARRDAGWTLSCCGQVCKVSRHTVDQLCILHRVSFIGGDPGYRLYLKEASNMCVISMASGILTTKCSIGVWADNSNSHLSDALEFSVRPRIDTSRQDFHRSCLSGHYSYIPFVEHSAAVRTSMSSAQIT